MQLRSPVSLFSYVAQNSRYSRQVSSVLSTRVHKGLFVGAVMTRLFYFRPIAKQNRIRRIHPRRRQVKTQQFRMLPAKIQSRVGKN